MKFVSKRTSRRILGMCLCLAMLFSVLAAGMTASAADLLSVTGTATYASAKKATVNITSIGGKNAYTMIAAEGDQTAKAAGTTGSNYSAITGAKVVYSFLDDYYGDKGVALIAYPSNSGKVEFKFPMAEGTTGITIVTYDPWGVPISTAYIPITGEIPTDPSLDEDLTLGITGVIQYKNPIKIQVNIKMEKIPGTYYALIAPGNQLEEGKASTWDTYEQHLTNAKIIFRWEDTYGKSTLVPFPDKKDLEFLVSAGSNPPEGFTIIGYDTYTKKVNGYVYIPITGEIPVVDPTAPDLGTNEYGEGVADETLEKWSHIKTNQVRCQTFSANNVNFLVNNRLNAEPARNKQKELYTEYYSSFKNGVSEYKYDELYLNDDYCQGLWDAFPATYGWQQDSYTEPGKWQKENYGIANMAYAVSLGGQNPWVVCDYLERTAGKAGTAGADWVAGYDEVACAAWLWHKDTGTFLTYESRKSLDQRIKYIQDNDIGGIIVWEMSGDNTKDYPMTTKLNNGVKKQGGRVIGYFTNWAVYNEYHQKQSPNDLPWDKMTHINYSFFQIENNEIKSIDPWADFDETQGGGLNMFGELKSCKEDYPETSLMASVGGWTRGDQFNSMVASPSNRATFINSCVKFMKDYPYFDGIDLDWEYPSIDRAPDYDDCADRGCPGNEKTNAADYVSLIKEMRAAFDKEFGAGVKQLTACVPADPDKMDKQNIKAVAEACTFINLMTYDYHGAFDPTPAVDPNSHLGYNSPLYRPAGDLKGSEAWNTKDSVDYCLSLGITADKINIGTPYYSRGWSGVPADANGMPEGLLDKTPQGEDSIEVAGVSVTPNNALLTVSESITLKAEVTPANATDSAVTWKTSDPSVATVDANGKVIALKSGTAEITATAGNHSASAQITVTVAETETERYVVMKKELTVAYVNGAIKPTTDYGDGKMAKAISTANGYLLPVRFIAEKFHMTVDYLGSGKTKITDADGTYLIVTRDSDIIEKYNADGSFKKNVQNTAKTEVRDQTITYVPLRAVSEALGLGVAYRSTPNGSYVVISTDKEIDAKDSVVDELISGAFNAGLK